MPLMVQNHAASTTLFALPGASRQPVIWAREGDPMGEDVQRVPDDLAKDIDFLRALDNGILSVIDGDDPDVLAGLQRSSTAYATRQAAIAAQQESLLDRRQDRDLLGVECIGPDARGTGQCGATVLVRAAEINGADPKPPLCDRHRRLAPEYYLTQEGSKGEGATESRPGQVTRVWNRIQLAAPVREQQR